MGIGKGIKNEPSQVLPVKSEKGKFILNQITRGQGNFIKKENEKQKEVKRRGLLLPIQLENRKFKLPSG